ncbi:kinase-like protein, partial [Macrolepiota fuliginosa MF-IS2]
IALYGLCSASMLYPHCYVLKCIVKPKLAEASTWFGDIYKAHHKNKTLCLKVVHLRQKTGKSESEHILQSYAKEVMVWAELHHPNVLPFYGIFYLNKRRERVCVVSRWMDRGDLLTYLKYNPSIPRTPFIHDIAGGLEYLHRKGMVHGDLKGANVLVNDSGRACIIGFGLTSIHQKLGYSRREMADGGRLPRWTAPELLDGRANGVTERSDVWAFGCVCYEIFTGEVPFRRCSTDAQIIQQLSMGTSPFGTARPSQIDSDMWMVMERCCAREPKSRP